MFSYHMSLYCGTYWRKGIVKIKRDTSQVSKTVREEPESPSRQFRPLCSEPIWSHNCGRERKQWRFDRSNILQLYSQMLESQWPEIADHSLNLIETCNRNLHVRNVRNLVTSPQYNISQEEYPCDRSRRASKSPSAYLNSKKEGYNRFVYTFLTVNLVRCRSKPPQTSLSGYLVKKSCIIYSVFGDTFFLWH